ncbi:MAG: SxtJ family membrane protein [Rhodospirillales bacterium]
MLNSTRVKQQVKVKHSSNRTFGITFGIVFLIIGCWPTLNKMDPYLWSIFVSSIFFVISIFYPNLLGGLNSLWYKFGLLLHSIMNPLILGVIFFSTFVPIGLTMRVLGKRPLPLRFSRVKNSYWIEKVPTGPDAETMKRQF